MNFRWAAFPLALSLSSCSQGSIENLATSTRDRVHTSGADSRSLAKFEEGAPTDGDYLISRRPGAASPTQPPKPAADTLSSEPTSPFAPVVEAEPPPASEPALRR